MNDLRTAAQQALEALGSSLYPQPRQMAAIAALRAALAEPPASKPLTKKEILAANYPDGEEAEPIIAAPDSELIAFSRALIAVQRDKKGRPMAYWSGLTEALRDGTAPPQRKPLTEEEITRCWERMGRGLDKYTSFARAIERAHGIGESNG